MAINVHVKLLALDSMVFIYHFGRVEPYFAQTVEIFTKAQRGDYQIVTSLVSVLESLSAPGYHNKPEIIKEINIYFREARCLHVVDVTWDIALEAARLRRVYAYLRTPDAIQLATAATAGAHTFITNDARLTKLTLPGLTIRTL